ncbi:MAG TPA: trypsin-like serine protease [Methyloceanibacter sp.]|nr:trypsin-like serine protease [Methyloceanibacter sp.]
MRTPTPRLSFVCGLALVSALLGAPCAQALPDATPDGADRFPFVVAIKAEGHLICSGTVLYPRIVVTAAHCLQQVVVWHGMRLYVEDYVPAEALSVSVVQGGVTRSYAVAEVDISPGWLASNAEQRSGLRLPHDVALLVTKDPIDVGVPLAGLDGPGALSPSSPAGPARHRGVLVAFGGAHCLSSGVCEDAGVRRFLRVVMKDGGTCFKSRRDRDAGLRFIVWCIDSGVMPGDSGGALLVEAPDGVLRYAGVISAGSGLPPALAALGAWRQSAAAALVPNRDFILEKARALGYAPLSSGP